jgi:hypothetical protein
MRTRTLPALMPHASRRVLGARFAAVPIHWGWLAEQASRPGVLRLPGRGRETTNCQTHSIACCLLVFSDYAAARRRHTGGQHRLQGLAVVAGPTVGYLTMGGLPPADRHEQRARAAARRVRRRSLGMGLRCCVAGGRRAPAGALRWWQQRCARWRRACTLRGPRSGCASPPGRSVCRVVAQRERLTRCGAGDRGSVTLQALHGQRGAVDCPTDPNTETSARLVDD